MSEPVPNEKVLKGQSLVPPSITGDVQFGTLVAWSDNKGQIFFADNQSEPPYQPVLVNPDWITFDTPAVVLAADWARVYLAWTDATGAVLLANSGDGWSKNVVVASAGWADSGPALAFGQDLGCWGQCVLSSINSNGLKPDLLRPVRRNLPQPEQIVRFGPADGA